MSRGIGEFEPIQDVTPEWLAVVIAMVTQLGDIWFLALLLATLYWVGASTRENIAAVAGVWLAGMGLYKGVKDILEFPRPDEPLLDAELLPWIVQPLYEVTATAGGYGFPSGHAVNTTIVYLGLAYVLAVSTPRRRFLAAATIVVAVGFSRVALGVHYVVDVVVGVAVGLLLLVSAKALMYHRLADRGTVSFSLAVVFGGFYVLATDASLDAVIVLAASLGAFAGWQLILLATRLVEVDLPSQAVRPIGVRGGLAVAALAPLVAALEYFPLFSAYAAGGVVGLAVAIAVCIPVSRHSAHARRVGVAVHFWIRMAALGVRYLFRPTTWRRALDFLRDLLERGRAWLRKRMHSTRDD